MSVMGDGGGGGRVEEGGGRERGRFRYVRLQIHRNIVGSGQTLNRLSLIEHGNFELLSTA